MSRKIEYEINNADRAKRHGLFVFHHAFCFNCQQIVIKLLEILKYNCYNILILKGMIVFETQKMAGVKRQQGYGGADSSGAER